MADPAFNAGTDHRADAAGGRAPRGAGGVPRARPVGVLLRGSVPSAGAAGRVRPRRWSKCWRPRVDLPLVAVVGVPLQIDGLLYNCAAVISRGTHPRRRAQDLSAQLSRVLRAAPVHAGRLLHARSTSSYAGSPTCRSATACCSRLREPAAVHVLRGDLRGSVDADPALVATRRWPARPCWSISRRRTSPSARTSTGASWCPTSRRAASLRICIARPAMASRPPISPGTATA